MSKEYECEVGPGNYNQNVDNIDQHSQSERLKRLHQLLHESSQSLSVIMAVAELATGADIEESVRADFEIILEEVTKLHKLNRQIRAVSDRLSKQ